MFDHIETKTETTVVHRLIIELSEEEVTEALVNPGKLLKRLRAERAKWHARPVWSSNGKADGRPRGQAAVKDAEKKSAKRRGVRGERKPIEREPCQTCGVLIAAYRQGKHKCRPQAFDASAE